MISKFVLNLFMMTVLCVPILFQSIARAEGDGTSSYAQVLGGIGVVNNNGGTNGTFGAGLGFAVSPKFSLGADYTYNTFTVASPLTANLSLILANGKYHFVQGNGLYLGLKVGAGTVATSGSALGLTATNFAWGPTVGTDLFGGTKFSVGVEAGLVWIANSSPSTNVLQVLADLKFHF